MSDHSEGLGSKGGDPGGRLPGAQEKVYDLLDIVEEFPEKIHELTDVFERSDSLPTEEPEARPAVEGRGDEGEAQRAEKIHDVAERAEAEGVAKQPSIPAEEEMRKRMVETVERMAREMIPGIVERMVREEIQKLKQEAEEEVQ